MNSFILFNLIETSVKETENWVFWVSQMNKTWIFMITDKWWENKVMQSPLKKVKAVII